LIPVPLPGYPGIDLYFKDESSHPTGSLKHRLACRSQRDAVAQSMGSVVMPKDIALRH
jgi:cysteine synthase